MLFRSLAELHRWYKSGKIIINGKEVPTYPISSYSKAVEIATTLKDWIKSGTFLLTNPVMPLPGVESGIKLNTLEENIPGIL